MAETGAGGEDGMERGAGGWGGVPSFPGGKEDGVGEEGQEDANIHQLRRRAGALGGVVVATGRADGGDVGLCAGADGGM